MDIETYRERAYNIVRTYNRPYQEKKHDARQLAIEIQAALSEQAVSYDDLADLQLILTTLARRTGLVREFHENGLI